MATETISRIAFNIQVANGTTSSGATKTSNVPLGATLSTTAFNDDKALAVVSAAVRILEKEVLGKQKITYSTVAS